MCYPHGRLVDIVETVRFIDSCVTHLTHLTYLEGAERSHRFCATLARILKYLADRAIDVPIGQEIEVLRLVIDAFNTAEDGVQVVELDAIIDDPRHVVRRASLVEGTLALVDCNARSHSPLHIRGTYDPVANVYRMEAQGIATDVQIPVRRNE